MRRTLESCKDYLGETYVLDQDYEPEDNPAHQYRGGAYWLLPENIEVARELGKELAP